MRNITVLIKPASGNCNMRCRYCFYSDEKAKRNIPNRGMMSEQTMRKIVTKFMDYSEGYITFAFQGGEPTLRGLEFFRQFVIAVKSHRYGDKHVNYAIQTNGLLINDDWSLFFKENGFLVGLSLDGPSIINDINRVDQQGNGTCSKILETASRLKKFNVDFNVLCVVNGASSDNAELIYRFFMENGLYYQQYIACLDPIFEERGRQQYSLTPDSFCKFLCSLFDLWYKDRIVGVFVYNSYFENLAAIITGRQSCVCGMNGICSYQNVVEADGSVYPCDFYMLDSYLLGNVNDNSVEELDVKRKDFLLSSTEGLEKCRTCKWGFICRGGCRRDRQYESKLGENYFCSAYYRFFDYIYERLKLLI